MRNLILLAGSVALLIPIGCDSGGDGRNDAVTMDSVATIFAADPRGDAVVIGDVNALTEDVDATFGYTDDSPAVVEEPDSINDVHRRALES